MKLALWQLMHLDTLLIPMNQRVLNKLNKEHNINGHSSSRHTECSNVAQMSAQMLRCLFS